MRQLVRVLLCAGLVSPIVAIAQTRSVEDGVYTKEQAVRGQKTYTVYCASCHASDLEGTNSGDSGAPPLRGEKFLKGSDANALFTFVKDNMPRDDPKGLTDGQYVDVLAYMFQENGFPAGRDELTPDGERLRAIKIVRERPGGGEGVR